MILAVVEYAHDPSGEGKPEWCRLRPAFDAEDDRWVPVEDPVSSYPSEGLVFWFRSPVHAKTGTYWITEIQRNPGGGQGKRPDVFGVQEAQRPYQLVELRGHADKTDLRRLCANGNFSFTHQPIGPILVKVPGSDSEWVGPLELTYTTDGAGRYVGSHDGLSGFLPVHEIAREALQEVFLDGASISILRPQRTIGGTVGWSNTQSDDQLLESALRRIRKVDRKAAEALGITRAVFEEYVKTLRNADLLGELALKERAREDALKVLIGRVEDDLLSRQDIAEALLAQDVVQQRLGTAIEAQVAACAEQIECAAKKRKEELLDEVSKVESRLESLRKEAEANEKTLDERQRQIDEKQQQAEKISHELGGRLKKTFDAVLSQPVDELGKHAVIQALVQASIERAGPTEFATLSLDPKGKPISELGELRGALITGANALQIHHSVLLSLLGALLSHRAVLCIGDSAPPSLDFAASLIAGSNVFRICVPSNIYGVNDLLRLPAVRRDDSRIVSVADVLKASETSRELVLLMFEGVNRAPLEVAFECLIRDGLDSSSAPAIPYSRDSRLYKPQLVRCSSNVHLTGTLTSGPSTFPIPKMLRKRIAVIDMDRPSPSSLGIAAVPTGLRIKSDDWIGWRESIVENSQSLQISRSAAGAVRTHAAEISAFLSAFGDAAFDEAIAEWLIARLAGAMDDAGLTKIAESCGEKCKEYIDEAIELGRSNRLAQVTQRADD